MGRVRGAGPRPSGSFERARLVTVATATLGLVALVAVMSDGSLLHARRTTDQVGRDVTIALGVAIALLAALSLVLIVFAIGGGPPAKPRKPSLLRSFVALAAALTIIAMAAHLLVRSPKPATRVTVATTAGPAATACLSPCVASHRHPGSSPWWLAIAVGGFVVVALIVGGRRRAAPPSVPDEVRPAMDRARSLFDASLDDLEAEPDPRRAISAAYGRLLDGLAGCGLARAPAETPAEHLARALGTLAVQPGALERLTDLFAEARFSDHALTAAHKTEAIAAFRAARDDLRPLQRELVVAP